MYELQGALLLKYDCDITFLLDNFTHLSTR